RRSHLSIPSQSNVSAATLTPKTHDAHATPSNRSLSHSAPGTRATASRGRVWSRCCESSNRKERANDLRWTAETDRSRRLVFSGVRHVHDRGGVCGLDGGRTVRPHSGGLTQPDRHEAGRREVARSDRRIEA